MKKCTCCKIEKPLSEFGKRNRKLPNGKIRVEHLTQCKKCVSEKSKKYYKEKIKNSVNVVYRFLDKEGGVLYIGKTQNLPRRVMRHISNTGHLPKECLNAIDKVEYIVTESIILMDIKELYYINLYKPKYNSNHIHEGTFIIKDFIHDEWRDISLFPQVSSEFESDEDINKVKSWKSIFVRKRSSNYIVYVEIEEDGIKKQINKGSFKVKSKADKLANKLREQREYVRKIMG